MPKTHYTLLVAEHDLAMRQRIREYCATQSEYTLTVLEASSTTEVRSICHTTQHLDGILLADDLPTIDSLQLIRGLQTEHGPHAFPIIMITTQASEATSYALLRAGAHDYVVKDTMTMYSLLRALQSGREKATFLHASQQRDQQPLPVPASVADPTTPILVFSAILEEINEGFIIVDRKWRYRYVNSHAERLLGRLRQTILGSTMWEQFPEAIDTAFYHQYHKALHEQTTVRFKEYFPLLNIWFNITAYPVEPGLAIYFTDITEEQQMKARIADLNHHLQERVSELQTVLEVVPLGIGIGDDPACTQITVNRYLAELLALPRQDSASSTILNHDDKGGFRLLVDGEELPDHALPMRYAAQYNVAVADQEITIVRADGSLATLLSYATPLRGTNNQVRGCVGAFLDITQRKQVEELLRQREHELQTIVTNIPDIIARFDRHFRYLYISPAIHAITGIQPEDYIGRTKHELDMSPELSDLWETQLSIAFATGTSQQFEFMLAALNGQRFYQALLLPQKNSAGAVESVLSIAHDITLYKQAQNALQFLADASTTLAGSLHYEKTLAQIGYLVVPAIADWFAIYLRDGEHHVSRLVTAATNSIDQTRVDQAETQRYSLEPRAQVGPAYVIRSGDAELWSDATTRGLAALASTEQWLEWQSLEVRSIMNVPLIARNRVFGVLSFATTTASERRFSEVNLTLAEEFARRAASALDNALLYREAQDAIQERDAFLSIASHELRNPLASLIGRAELLQRRYRQYELPDQRNQRDIDQIVEQGQRISLMLTDLLDRSSLDYNQLQINPAPLDLNGLVQQVVNELQPALTQYVVVSEMAATPVMINGDSVRLEQVIYNLLSNAIKYSSSGAKITVAVAKEAQWARIDVSDQGIGIPANALSHIFKRFYRVANAIDKGHHGSGIGLYVVHEIITRHRGYVEVTSQEDIGSTFTVKLPLLAA